MKTILFLTTMLTGLFLASCNIFDSQSNSSKLAKTQSNKSTQNILASSSDSTFIINNGMMMSSHSSMNQSMDSVTMGMDSISCHKLEQHTSSMFTASSSSANINHSLHH